MDNKLMNCSDSLEFVEKIENISNGRTVNFMNNTQNSKSSVENEFLKDETLKLSSLTEHTVLTDISKLHLIHFLV